MRLCSSSPNHESGPQVANIKHLKYTNTAHTCLLVDQISFIFTYDTYSEEKGLIFVKVCFYERLT